MNVYNIHQTKNELVLTLQIEDNNSKTGKNLLLFFAYIPWVGLLAISILAFLYDISLLLISIPLILFGLYFYGLYNWNMRGQETLIFTKSHLKKINDHHFYKSTVHDADFKRLDFYIIVNGEWISGSFDDTLHSPQPSDYEERVNLNFVLNKDGKQLIVSCAIKIPYIHAEQVMRKVKVFIKD